MKQLHEYAKFFPPIEGEEFEALCQDVKAHGLLNPIVLYDDKILDGRNRARACEKVGVSPKYQTYPKGNGSALDYVISQNVKRRHLTPSQLGILALDLEAEFAKEAKAEEGERIKAGQKNANKNNGAPRAANSAASHFDRSNRSSVRAAKALNIGHNTVGYAKRLKRDHPEKVAAVRAGKVSLKEAFVQARDERVIASLERDKARKAKKRAQQEVRQVAMYHEATKAYIIALKVAEGDVERFSPEAVQFTVNRHIEVRKLMKELEDALYKKIGVKAGSLIV